MDILVSTEWLAARIGADDVTILDATMHLPGSDRDAAAEYAAGHIPDTRFLDLDSFIDPASPVPRALPSAEQFAERLGKLGVAPGGRVVVYDDSPIRSAARAWFAFRHFGYDNVAILDGGLGKWRAEGRPLETGTPARSAREHAVPSGGTRAVDLADMRAHVEAGDVQIVDARDEARFEGREGSGSAGHILGSRNLPFAHLLNADGTYRSPDEIRDVFAAAGVDVERPIITSCNSGVTAAVLAFALERAGEPGARLYDGSWLEWGARDDTPKERGPAA